MCAIMRYRSSIIIFKLRHCRAVASGPPPALAAAVSVPVCIMKGLVSGTFSESGGGSVGGKTEGGHHASAAGRLRGADRGDRGGGGGSAA